MKYLEYIALRCGWAVLSILPYKIRFMLLRAIARAAYCILPALKRVSLINLEQAFPEYSAERKAEIVSRAPEMLAELLADIVEVPRIDDAWLSRNVDLSVWEAYTQLRQRYSDRGVILATGHMGSFELMAQVAALKGDPIAVIARTLKNEKIDQFLNSYREWNGNKLIARAGAYRAMLKALKAGQSVGILFDQNLTRNYAVFPEWFGRPAATTAALGLAALYTQAPIFVVSWINRPGQQRAAAWHVCDCRDIYDDQELDKDQKVLAITQRASDAYQEIICKHPEGWFWMHKRWKTTPNDDQIENFYR